MISVIVPVYNVEAYVERSLKSIQNQSYKDLEIIIVDDGSTDRSGEMCDEIAKSDKRMKVIHQKNAGTSAARNRALQDATGEYISFVDSDDYIAENYFEVLYENIIKYNAQVSVCSYLYIWEKNRFGLNLKRNNDNKSYCCTGREASEKIVKYSQRRMITPWGKLFHSSLKEKFFFPVGRRYEDEFILYRVFYETDKVVIANIPLYFYVQRSSSFMNIGFSEQIYDKLTALEEAIKYFEEHRDEDLREAAISRYIQNIQIYWYRVHFFMKNRKDLEKRLLQEHKQSIKEYNVGIRSINGFINKIAFAVFYISPMIYGIIATVISLLIKEE